MRAILPLLILMIGVAPPARADFMTALAAYDAGDYAVAFTEWRRLAAHGDAESQVALAGLYEAGLGAPRDDRAAARWYRKAAMRGHRIARLNLGELYARGRGVGRDFVRAWYWLGLAAADGSVWARHRQSEVARRMTVAERQRARAMFEAPPPTQ